jgi:hypothetical protein
MQQYAELQKTFGDENQDEKSEDMDELPYPSLKISESSDPDDSPIKSRTKKVSADHMLSLEPPEENQVEEEQQPTVSAEFESFSQGLSDNIMVSALEKIESELYTTKSHRKRKCKAEFISTGSTFEITGSEFEKMFTTDGKKDEIILDKDNFQSILRDNTKNKVDCKLLNINGKNCKSKFTFYLHCAYQNCTSTNTNTKFSLIQ